MPISSDYKPTFKESIPSIRVAPNTKDIILFYKAEHGVVLHSVSGADPVGGTWYDKNWLSYPLFHGTLTLISHG